LGGPLQRRCTGLEHRRIECWAVTAGGGPTRHRAFSRLARMRSLRCACTRATGMGSACHRRKDVRDADKPSEPRGWHPISTPIIWRTQNGPDGARLSSLPAASHQLHRARAIRSSISANRARSRPFGGLASLGQTDPGHPPGTAASNRRSWSPTPGTRLCHTPANRHGLCCRVPADNRPH
jgi:hypothetical protein